MRLVLHPQLAVDIEKIRTHYQQTQSPQLADEFYAELRDALLLVASRPEAFAVRHGDLRRLNLPRFPYHLLFRIAGDTVRVLVLRHHRRHPAQGTRRR